MDDSPVANHKKAFEFYEKFIRKGDLCFDVGANVGSRTAIFRTLGARVVAIEPEQSSIMRLRQQFGEDEEVFIIAKALDKSIGNGKLSVCDQISVVSTMSTEWKEKSRLANRFTWTQVEHVETTTLDTLISEYGVPRFCKIDVEGFEQSVLAGLSQPIPYISFEFAIELFENAKSCLNYLANIGSISINCSLAESMKFLLPCWSSPNELYARIDEVKSEDLWGDIYVQMST